MEYTGRVLMRPVPQTLQAGLVSPGIRRDSPRGLLVRGVVVDVATFDVEGAKRSRPLAQDYTLPGVYCDVLVYTDYPGLRGTVLRSCLVSTGRGGLLDETVWVPQAAKIDLSTRALLPAKWHTKGVNPASVDGDHVVVGFLDDSFDSPIVLRAVPHPAALQTSAGPIHSTTRFPTNRAAPAADSAHRGIVWGVDGNGNFFIDARDAFDGTIDGDGRPVRPDATDPSVRAYGHVQIRTGPRGNFSVLADTSLMRIDHRGVAIDTASPTFASSLRMGATSDEAEYGTCALGAQTSTWRSRFRIGTDGRIEISAGLDPTDLSAAGTKPVWLRGSRVLLSDEAWEETEAVIRGTTYVAAMNDVLTALENRIAHLEAGANAAHQAANSGAPDPVIVALNAAYAIVKSSFSSGQHLSTRVFLDPAGGSVPPGELTPQL